MEIVGAIVGLAFVTFGAAQPAEGSAGPRPGKVSADAVSWSSGVVYEYDGSGNVKKIGSDAYVYDSANRLASGAVSGSSQTYTYDSFGNRTGCTPQGGGDCQYGWTIDSSTNRVVSRSYDQRGNMLQLPEGNTLEYDALGMVYRENFAGGHRDYLYTADDERLVVYSATGSAGSWTWTLRDLDKKVSREFTSDDSVNFGIGNFQWVKDYIWRDGLLLATRQPDPYASGTVATYHYHLDHLGTPRQITDATGAVIARHDYLPFGPELSGNPSEPVPTRTKFTGHERDTVADRPPLDYMHARYYEGRLGRFLSVDPVLDVKRAVRSPQMWNRYSYVVNNPINRIDPDGRLVQLAGTDEERKKALELIKANLREQDRKYVTMNKNGVLSVDSKAKGGLGLSMLRDLATNKATVNVSLGLTATEKMAPGPSPTRVLDLQAAAGGGVTLRPWQATSGSLEVHVDPRGNLQFGASASLVMGHELLGHAWDLMIKGTSSERSAVTTETNLLFQLGLPQFRPVPTDREQP
ncbi:MAG: RHS repeat-associated core domain-containing protein [Acidobacteriota bacterium]